MKAAQFCMNKRTKCDSQSLQKNRLSKMLSKTYQVNSLLNCKKTSQDYDFLQFKGCHTKYLFAVTLSLVLFTPLFLQINAQFH